MTNYFSELLSLHRKPTAESSIGGAHAHAYTNHGCTMQLKGFKGLNLG